MEKYRKSYFLPIFGLFFPYFAFFSPIFWISGFFYSVDGQGFCNHSCTRVREPPVALHVSRYMCRSRFPQNPGFLRCSSSIALHPPPKRPCCTCRPLIAIGAARQAASESSSYTCGCRVTLCNYGNQAVLDGVPPTGLQLLG